MEFEIILIILSVLVVTTNMTVIAMVIFIKELRSFTNYFVVSLAVSDALMGPLLLVLHLSWIHEVIAYATGIIMLSCVGNICAVTWDRYTAVMDPFMYRTKLKKCYRKLLVAVWLISISYSLVPLAWQTDQKSYYHKVYLVIAVLVVILPYLVTSIGYVRIFARLRYHTAKLKNEGISRSQREGAHKASLEGKTVKVFVVIVGVFLLSWLPVLYMTLVDKVAERPDLVPSVLVQANLLALALSSVVDPILYAFMKRDFNRQIQRKLRCCKSMRIAAWVQ